MISPTQPLLDEIKESSDDELAGQRRRRQNCLADAKRRRTCEGATVAVAKLLDEDSADKTTKNGSDSNLRVMKHLNVRKLSESRGINLPIIEMKRTQSVQATPTFGGEEEYSPVTQIIKFSDSISNDRSSHSQSFIQKSTSQLPELLDIRIFFSDGKCVQFSVEDGSQAQSSDLLQLISEYLDIPEDVVNCVFALWLVSPLLEVQLKPHHVANEVRNKWPSFLLKYSNASEKDIAGDEPLLILKRNVNLTIETERIFESDYEKIVDILYLDAKDEYLTGRYLVDDVDVALELAALQLLIEEGPFEEAKSKEDEAVLDLVHDKLAELVPSQHLSHVRSFQLFGLSFLECKHGLEKDVVEQYKACSRMYQSQYDRKKRYLDLLRETPFYGAAFFTGKTERRSSTLPLLEFGRRFFTGSTPTARMNVRIGIQSKNITVVDPVKSETLLTQRIDDCTWLKDDNVPAFYLHFLDPEFVTRPSSPGKAENGDEFPASKLLQIFSKQAFMMVALLDSLDQIAQSEIGSAHDLSHTNVSDIEREHVVSSDENESQYSHPNSAVTDHLTSSKASSKSSYKTAPIYRAAPSKAPSIISKKSSCRSNKLSKLCLATLDPAGCCVEAHGSLKKLFVLPVH